MQIASKYAHQNVCSRTESSDQWRQHSPKVDTGIVACNNVLLGRRGTAKGAAQTATHW